MATGSAWVSVQAIVDGLKVAFCVSVNGSDPLCPVPVSTSTGPVTAPLGTVVRMNVSVQSAVDVIEAASVPPAPSGKRIWLGPWASPNAEPSTITVLPEFPARAW